MHRNNLTAASRRYKSIYHSFRYVVINSFRFIVPPLFQADADNDVLVYEPVLNIEKTK